MTYCDDGGRSSTLEEAKDAGFWETVRLGHKSWWDVPEKAMGLLFGDYVAKSVFFPPLLKLLYKEAFR